MKRMLIFWEMRDSSMSFSPIPLQTFTPYNSQNVMLGTHLTLPKSMGKVTIFLFQKV